MPFRNILILMAAALISFACYGKAERNRYSATVTEAMMLVSDYYVDEVTPRDLFQNAMQGMVSELDPYSSYISPEDFRAFQEDLDQEFGGVGIVVELNPETNRLTVLSPLTGTPAYRAGMRAGDVILEINGESTEGMTLRDSVAIMRGEPGTNVHLSVLHAGDTEPVEFTVTRDTIPIESVLGDRRLADGRWDFRLEQDPRILYIRLTTFGENSLDEIKATMAAEQQSDSPFKAIILDLRGNAGGLLSTAVDLCDMLISGGEIVSTRGRNGEMGRQYMADAETIIDTNLPMVVLVNTYSASASEIVAACLKDHQRAVIVGTRTWGKGTVQNIIPLENGESALKLTTATYWRPSGRNIHRRKDAGDDDDWGVQPDPQFHVPLTNEEFELVLRKRRERDIYRAPDEAPGTSEPEDAVEPPSGPPVPPVPPDDPEEEAFVDPQLKVAIEYLQKRLNEEGQQPSSAARPRKSGSA